MKKLPAILILAFLFISCKTPKIITLQEAEYQTQFNYYDVIIVSKSSDFFKVYKINNTDYALYPVKNTDHIFNIDDLSSCIIFKESEAKEFKESLEQLIQVCENRKNNIFLAEVKVLQGVTKKTTNVEIADEEPQTVSTDKDVSTAFILQAAIRKSTGTKQLELSARPGSSGAPYSLTLTDVKNLIKALEK